MEKVNQWRPQFRSIKATLIKLPHTVGLPHVWLVQNVANYDAPNVWLVQNGADYDAPNVWSVQNVADYDAELQRLT